MSRAPSALTIALKALLRGEEGARWDAHTLAQAADLSQREAHEALRSLSRDRIVTPRGDSTYTLTKRSAR